MRRLFQQGWGLFKNNWKPIVGIVLVIWVPIELLSSYRDHFVYKDDFIKSFRFARFLDNVFGVIGVGGIISIAHECMLGNKADINASFSMGCGAWWRMMWAHAFTNFLLTAAILLAGLASDQLIVTLLIAFPVAYLVPRLSLVYQIVFLEKVSVIGAMRRSFQLTKGLFWPLLRLLLILVILIAIPIGFIVALTLCFPELDHWLVDACTMLFMDFIAAYGIIVLLLVYKQVSAVSGTATEAAGGDKPLPVS